MSEQLTHFVRDTLAKFWGTNNLGQKEQVITEALQAWNRPKRSDDVEAWLKRHRDVYSISTDTAPQWFALDFVLDDYRLHADTGTALNEKTSP